MSRPTTKTELLSAAEDNFRKLNDFIGTMSREELCTPFDFSSLNKKEAHWSRDKNLRDVLSHLYEWHMLLIDWVRENMGGGVRPFLPEPYTWKTYGEMNMEFWRKHQDTQLQDIKAMLQNAHNEIIALIEGISEEELFTKGVYKWVGGSTLGSYFISCTSSHYDWALKKLKAHRKIAGGKNGKA